MIVVTVQLYPASGGEPQLLGRAMIANDGTGDLTHGNYDMYVQKNANRGSASAPWWRTPTRIWRRGRVEYFPRKRLGCWDLLYRALQSAVGDRNVQR